MFVLSYRFAAYNIPGDDMIKFVRIISALIISLALILTQCTCAFAQEDREYRSSYALMEVSTGTLVRERRSGERVRMGSFNKLMTVLLAAEAVAAGELTFDTVLTASEHANSMQGAQIWLMPGEKMTLGDLLKGVIIGNANDAACVIAEKLGGSEEKFTAMMNKRAEELGMNDTLFTNCNGYYDDENQYTTAYDAALLLCELSKHEMLTEMFTTRLDELKDGEVQLVSANKMAYKYNGAAGFKCGCGPSSGYFAAEGACREGITFVAAVMDCEEEDTCLALARELLDMGFSGYAVISPDIPEDMVSETVVRRGVEPMVRLSVEPVGNVLVPKGMEGDVEVRFYIPSAVYAPVEKGDRIGELQIYLGDRLLKKCDVNSAENVGEKNYLIVLINMLKNVLKF